MYQDLSWLMYPNIINMYLSFTLSEIKSIYLNIKPHVNRSVVQNFLIFKPMMCKDNLYIYLDDRRIP